MSKQYLLFNVSEETYALPVENVKEVINYKELNIVPNAEEHILGMLNIRGEIIAVLDSTKILNTKVENINSKNNKIIIFEAEKENVGIVVSSVSSVVSIKESEIKPKPKLEEDSYCSGVVYRDNKLYIIIDTSKTKLNLKIN